MGRFWWRCRQTHLIPPQFLNLGPCKIGSLQTRRWPSKTDSGLFGMGPAAGWMLGGRSGQRVPGGASDRDGTRLEGEFQCVTSHANALVLSSSGFGNASVFRRVLAWDDMGMT